MTQRVFEAKAGVISRELDGSICLVDPETWQVAVLNETASDLWRLVRVRCALPEIIESLAEAYQTGENTVRDDVREALDQLVAGGFVLSTESA